MSKLPLLIDAEEIKQLDTSLIRFVDLGRVSIYKQLHLQNAISLSPKQLVRQFEESTGLLPTVQDLLALVDILQISPQHHVIAYDDEGGGWASRLIWTLHCMGFYNASLLNGGIHACITAGLEMSNETVQLETVAQLFEPDFSQIDKNRIEYSELLQRVQSQNIQLWDCRSLEEFTGEKRTARRVGHMPKAIHFDWLNLFDRENDLKLKDLAYIRQQLTALGLDLTQPTVVYCQSHHRSSLAYLVAKLLDCPVRAYDGAWSEWGNQSDSLIESGVNP